MSDSRITANKGDHVSDRTDPAGRSEPLSMVASLLEACLVPPFSNKYVNNVLRGRQTAHKHIQLHGQKKDTGIRDKNMDRLDEVKIQPVPLQGTHDGTWNARAHLR